MIVLGEGFEVAVDQFPTWMLCWKRQTQSQTLDILRSRKYQAFKIESREPGDTRPSRAVKAAIDSRNEL